MEDGTIKDTNSPSETRGSPVAKGGDNVPNVVGAVGVEPAPNSTPTVGGGTNEAVGSEIMVKKPRGRPRKYGVNGNPFSPSSAPSQLGSVKRSRGRPRGSGILQHLASIGGVVADTAGGGFTPHVVTVNTGEDVVNTILSFSQKGPRAVCVLSAIGVVSTVIIRQSGGVRSFEGLFEILSLTGSYTVGTRCRSGTFTVSLAKPDGRVFGGGVEGPLIAAAPIQLIVGSFKPNICKEIQRSHSTVSPTLRDMPGHPEMEEGEQDESVPTTNGLFDNVNSGTSNEIAHNEVPASQNMPSASSNGALMDSRRT
ncbi:hypothetical protein QN277_002940 [Acacia crassicarpa]|uniref:AT-hook motif nuclear-localized protein n=1 Tax=Acacia crassicarpa TaxID=499986 RepID=A0AAE1NC10_9FABA|nr:hypothetical protein QN277_002940 [Acacia crassicarpa]